MVQGAGIGFNYNQKVAAVKQQVEEMFIEHVGDMFEFAFNEAFDDGELSSFHHSFICPSSQLSKDESLLIGASLDMFIHLTLDEKISKIAEINVTHRRILHAGCDSTKIKIQVWAVPTNNNN